MPNERSSYRGRASGAEVTQLTRYRGHSHPFYFTSSGWSAGDKKLLFASDRNASDRSGYGNVYRVPVVEVETLPLARDA